MEMINVVFGYARVSTMGQDLEQQEAELRSRGATALYKEKYTGTTTARPELKKLLGVLKPGDTLMVTKLDRLARNTKEGIEIIETLFKKGVRVHVLNVGLLEDTTMGRFFLQTMLAVAEMERNMIVDRVQAGKAHAKATDPNYREGRPKKYKNGQLEHAYQLKQNGMTYKQIETSTGVPKMALYRYEKKLEAAAIK